MKVDKQTSDGILGGRQVKMVIDLEKDISPGNFIVDTLGFSKGSVQVFCSTNSGVAGSGTIHQKIMKNGAGANPDSGAATLAFTPGTVSSQYNLAFTGRYLVVDLAGVTLGSEGRVEMIFIMKL